MGSTAWGLQFHLEVTHAAVEALVRAFGEDDRTVGGAESILTRAEAVLPMLAPRHDAVLTRFATLVTEGDARVEDASSVG